MVSGNDNTLYVLWAVTSDTSGPVTALDGDTGKQIWASSAAVDPMFRSFLSFGPNATLPLSRCSPQAAWPTVFWWRCLIAEALSPSLSLVSWVANLVYRGECRLNLYGFMKPHSTTERTDEFPRLNGLSSTWPGQA